MFGFSAQVSGVWGVGYGGSECLRSALGGLEFSASKGLGSALWSLGSREAHGCGVCAWVPGVWGSGSALVGLRFRGPRVCCPGGLWVPLQLTAVVVPGASCGGREALGAGPR